MCLAYTWSLQGGFGSSLLETLWPGTSNERPREILVSDHTPNGFSAMRVYFQIGTNPGLPHAKEVESCILRA